MSVSDLLSYLCAALSALGVALANVMQRKASLQTPSGQPFGLGLLLDLVRSRVWLIGFGGLIGSFLFQAAALGLGQLSAVEPIITLEVPLTLLAASRVFKTSLHRPEWAGILVMTVGMIVFVAMLAPRPGDETHVSHVIYGAAGGASAATVLVLVLVSLRGGSLWKTACLGAAAGTSFGLTATFMKETVAQGQADGLVGVLTTWQTYTVIGFGVLGLVLVQWALHSGPLLAAQPGFTLLDALVSIFWGVLVFEEVTRTGWWLAPATLGAVAVGVGVFVLAHSPLLVEMKADDEAQRRPAAAVG